MATTSRLFPVRAVWRTAFALAALLAAALLFANDPAGAFVTTAGSTKAGLQPRSTLLGGSQLNINEYPLEPEKFANPQGKAIVSSSKTYAIYWDPTDHYDGDWQHLIDTFLQNVGTASKSLDNVFAVDAQYTDLANEHALYKSAFQGAYTDTDAYPSSSGCTDPQPMNPLTLIGAEVAPHEYAPICLTDQQIQKELETFIAQHSLQKGMGTIFYLITPPGVTVCLDAGGANGHCSDFTGEVSEIEVETKAKIEAVETHKPFVESANYKSYVHSFCSYHSDINPTSSLGDENTILYGVIPWTAGGLGDGNLLFENDQNSAYDCQDGGYDPSSKPAGKPERRKEKGPKEIEENEKKSPEEREKIAEAELLEGPHPQEPNQVKCPSPDGWCDTGLADIVANQIAVEQQNIVTDPLLDAWRDPKGNEATDECRDWFAPVVGGNVGTQEGSLAGTLYDQSFGGNNYYLNTAFNLAGLKLPYPGGVCLKGVSLVPQFTAPSIVNTNEIVGFDGMESNISLGADTVFSPGGESHTGYATYTWNFGDGSAPVTGFAPGAPLSNSPAVSPCGAAEWEAPCAASAYHSYQYGGIYEVSLTVADVGGNTATWTERVTVDGAPAPAPEPTPTPSTTPSSGPGGSAGGPGGSPTAPSTPATPSTPPPVVTGFATTKSLKKVLSSGLPVRYTTNEQVAGSIQVLLESSIAKRLGVHGATATGLPKGTPRSIVVGTAVLVTTKAGQGTIRIKFSSSTAERLKGTHKLKLMLRLFARNASRQSPQTTTALSTVVLNP